MLYPPLPLSTEDSLQPLARTCFGENLCRPAPGELGQSRRGRAGLQPGPQLHAGAGSPFSSQWPCRGLTSQQASESPRVLTEEGSGVQDQNTADTPKTRVKARPRTAQNRMEETQGTDTFANGWCHPGSGSFGPCYLGLMLHDVIGLPGLPGSCSTQSTRRKRRPAGAPLLPLPCSGRKAPGLPYSTSPMSGVAEAGPDIGPHCRCARKTHTRCPGPKMGGSRMEGMPMALEEVERRGSCWAGKQQRPRELLCCKQQS